MSGTSTRRRPTSRAAGVDDLFRSGNTKLNGGGVTIWGFGLPSRHTCPARTPTCSARCYSHRMESYRKAVGASHRRNLQAAKRDDFVAKALAEIDRKGITVLRVHTGGELFAVEYAAKWLEIFKARPKVKFFLWTRVWRLPRFEPVLAAMAALPNVRLWYSLDRDTGVPTTIPARVKLAYMQVTAEDRPPAGDLVFRVLHLRKNVARKTGGVNICPVETGLPEHAGSSCSTCKSCWKALPGDRQVGRITLTTL